MRGGMNGRRGKSNVVPPLDNAVPSNPFSYYNESDEDFETRGMNFCQFSSYYDSYNLRCKENVILHFGFF